MEILIATVVISIGLVGLFVFLLSNRLVDMIRSYEQSIIKHNSEHQAHVSNQFSQLQTSLSKQQLGSLQTLQTQLQESMNLVRQSITETLANQTQSLNQQMDKLSQTTEHRLKDISGQVEKRLSEGFEKTTATFTDIIKRLALIDEAQKKITELSSNVVSLQEILSDKRSRGAFGEVQLNSLIRNVLPEQHFSLQYTLSNNKRADCILFLPAPTGNIVIDAKFPLENYQNLSDTTKSNDARLAASQQFRLDVRKHITDIAEKYIIKNETADGAVMFIPAEAIFAEIHANYSDLVELAHRAKVWLVSPTTMMAILTTARAVLKDDATRKQVHIIQEHLAKLAKDFTLFRTRMNKLSQHIKQASTDVDQIHISAEKITNRFTKIEQVDIENREVNALEEEL